MELELFVIGISLLVVSYLVALKKQTWLLSGFNEKNIRNKARLGTVVGAGFFLPLGLLLILHSFIDYPYEKTVSVSTMFVLLTSVYVFINRKLLEK
ncbi:DUF3784 domain-containing protein [Alkalihalobacillus sp. R86527]|uniref:DUF3784 domain-containing protein n=1 Tax=Alkalihalobacillus sp. R86527 TaxID=3093863 RepID=UPI0036729639